VLVCDLNNQVKLGIIALVGGIIITMLTALVNMTPAGLMGATWYGLPLPWYIVIVYPGSPTRIRPLRLIADIVVWAIVVWVVLFVISKVRKKK